MSTLYIVATPIGNLEDISMRALRILSEVDFVLCEDTRVTKKLLNRYKINTPTLSYHQHSGDKKTEKIINLLKNNKDLALVTDAGTPGISDPGGKLVSVVIEKLPSVRIESIPGPSAVTAALSISGISTDKFVFMGFPPHKKGRQTFIEKIADSIYPVVVYESKHRIIKFLDELEKLNKEIEKHNNNVETPYQGVSTSQGISTNQGVFVHKKDKKEKKIPVTSIVVCRELSKMHETVYRGELKTIANKIKENKDDQKGEFVIVIGK